jgi:hypothetical protein
VSDPRPRLIRTAAENAYVLTRPTLARRDAPIPKLRSRLVKILNVPLGKRVVPTARGWAGEKATPPVFTRLRPCLGRGARKRDGVGEKGGHFEQPIGPRMQNQDKGGNFV